MSDGWILLIVSLDVVLTVLLPGAPTVLLDGLVVLAALSTFQDAIEYALHGFYFRDQNFFWALIQVTQWLQRMEMLDYAVQLVEPL